MSDTPKRKQLVFSGMQPTNTLHLGNYLGALKNWVKLQDRMPCIYCVVDVFYVRDGYGHKVTHPQRLASVEARLLKALMGEDAESATP